MIDKKKEEFINECYKTAWINLHSKKLNLPKLIKTRVLRRINKEWNWITQNYIPREKVEGLKMEKKYCPISLETQVEEGWNSAVEIFNQKLDEVLKK